MKRQVGELRNMEMEREGEEIMLDGGKIDELEQKLHKV